MPKQKSKKTNIKKLQALIDLVDKNRKEIAQNLYRQLEFMDSTLNSLQEQITNEGAVIKSINGNGFETINENPAQKSYNTMIGRYNALIKTFIDLLPKNDDDSDELVNWINGD